MNKLMKTYTAPRHFIDDGFFVDVAATPGRPSAVHRI